MTLLVAAAGLATFIASVGVGRLALGRLGARLPAPWGVVTGALLGLALESALVQAAAMPGASPRPVLVALWLAFVALGLAGVAGAARAGAGSLAPPGWRLAPADRLPLALGATAALTNLLIALAPSTKIDELFYHMLLPRRIVADGGLRFYRLPWEGAAIPQMAYQIGEAPLHALGVPDAPNVTSWALALTLAWFGWYLLAERERTRALAAWWVAVVAVGLYAAVWHVTAGAHALGDLAFVAATVAVVDARALRDRVAPAAFALAVGVLTWAAASTKASLVPVSGALLLWGAAAAWRRASGAERYLACAAAAAPWVAFGVPLVAWTWAASGAPYGPFFAWHFAGTVYDARAIQVALARTADFNRTAPHSAPVELTLRWVPLLLAAAALSLARGPWPRPTRAALAAVALGHVLFVLGAVSWDLRFLSGLAYALALLFALGGGWAARAARGGRATALVGAACTVPWLAAQLYHAGPFVAVAVGLQDRERFLRRYVALREDYVALDRILPRDAVLVTAVGRTSSFYAPRPPVVGFTDLAPADEPRAYVITTECGAGAALFGEVVYRNPRAVVVAYRTPGRRNELDAICVRRFARRP